MEVEEGIGSRDIPQAKGRDLPGYPANKVDAMAVQNATGSLEIMGQLVLNEWELLRHRIRELGAKIRQMSSKVAAVTVKRLWNQLLSLLKRHGNSIPKQFELDAAQILNEMEKKEVERAPPRDTLADIRRVLLEDPDEEGVVLRKGQSAWRAMPPPRRNAEAGSPTREGDCSAYQLFNRPLPMRDEDDFDRLSGPSTHFAQSESEKILSLEAQLSLLTRQLNMVMASGGIQQFGGGGSQRPSRPVSRSHSRASLYQPGGGQPMAYALPSPHHHHHQSHHHARHPPQSPSPTSDDDGVYMHDDSASSYASPSHTMIPLPPPLPPTLQLLQPMQHQVAGRRESMMMTGDATSASIPPAPPLPPFGLQQLQERSGNSSKENMASSPSSSALVLPLSSQSDDVAVDSDAHLSLSPPGSPLPPPPPGLVVVGGQQQLQQLQESSSSRSFLDDISKGNFALRKTSSEKSPTGSLLSSTSGEETEHDENSSGPLVKPTTKQLLSRKVSLKRISADRSPGGTPQNRNRSRRPSLGQDGGRGLYTGDYLAAALAKQFNTIRVNEEDDDQSVTAGDQSWLDD